MIKILIVSLVTMLSAGVASAEIINTGDGGTTAFGDTQGFAIDFDSTLVANADWTPDLVAASTYNLNSVNITYGGPGTDGDNGIAKYLGVYTSLSGGVLSGFQGASTNTFLSPVPWRVIWPHGISAESSLPPTPRSDRGLDCFISFTKM
jgi:hypothetical protein